MQRFLRKWHRWIGFPAGIFLLFAAVTGILLAGTEFFGAEEALRERTRDLISPTTTLTPDTEFAAALARSRSSVSALTGNAPIDQIVWQFKGETPTIVFFLGKPTGREDRKVTVDARTGMVLRTEAYADKPFLLRLHSGEAFGDGGLVLAMFWGASLVLLTVSGIIIYFYMRRPKRSGLGRIFWSVLVCLIAAKAPSARADSPFYTDDPVFSPGWEIKAGLTGERNSSGSVLTDVLDWNYAVVPKVRFNLTTYVKHIWPVGEPGESGYGDTEFKVKWRFLEEDTTGRRPALGIAPKVFIPTASKSRGLTDGAWRFQVPLQFGKTVGRWYHFGEAGYQWASGPASDSAYSGVGTLRTITNHLAVGTELFGGIPMNSGNDWQLLTTLGAVYTFNEHWSLKSSVSHSLRDKAKGGPSPSGVFYLVSNF
jgi:hypothetical protein